MSSWNEDARKLKRSLEETYLEEQNAQMTAASLRESNRKRCLSEVDILKSKVGKFCNGFAHTIEGKCEHSLRLYVYKYLKTGKDRPGYVGSIPQPEVTTYSSLLCTDIFRIVKPKSHCDVLVLVTFDDFNADYVKFPGVTVIAQIQQFTKSLFDICRKGGSISEVKSGYCLNEIRPGDDYWLDATPRN
jgi:hypothetical protein